MGSVGFKTYFTPNLGPELAHIPVIVHVYTCMDLQFLIMNEIFHHIFGHLSGGTLQIMTW